MVISPTEGNASMAMRVLTIMHAAKVTLEYNRKVAAERLAAAQETFDREVTNYTSETDVDWLEFAQNIKEIVNNNQAITADAIPLGIRGRNYSEGQVIRVFSGSRPTKWRVDNEAELEILIGFLSVQGDTTVSIADLKAAGLERAYASIRWDLK